MFNIRKKDPKSDAEEKLEQISQILFPPMSKNINEDGVVYQIDYSADSNLDAALVDLEDGHNDQMTQRTIRSVADKLVSIRRLLEAYAEFDPEAKYIVVDDGGDERDQYLNDIEGNGC